MSFVDPTEIRIESSTPPIWEKEEDFSQVMNDQLKHAPWVVISVVAHAVVLLVIWMAMDGVRETRQKVVISSEIPEPEDEILEEDDVVEEVKEEVVEEVLVEETPVAEVESETENVIDDAVAESVESAFTSNQWNTAIGPGGGAAGPYGGRQRGGGGPGKRPPNHKAITRGLKWLAAHQDEDGKWDCDAFMKHDLSGARCDGAGNPVHDIGVTGLALLAFLGDGSTMRSGVYKDNIKAGVRWLRKQQADDGLFGTNASSHYIYDHAIASYAMVEAYGLSRYKTLRKVAQGGINYLEKHRNPYGCWRYQPRDNDNDISITGWCIMAYKSAKDFGLDVSTQALKIAANYIEEMTDTTTGRTGYNKRGGRSSRHVGAHGTEFPVEHGEATTAVALFCRYFLGQDHREVEVMDRSAQLIAARPPQWQTDGRIDHYYWYYATYALYQRGGKLWKEWSRKLTPAVVKTQRGDGNFDGSWNPAGAWGEDGGRVYSTATLVLTLQAHYRYSRLVR